MELVVQTEKDKVKTISETQVLHALESLGFSEMEEEVKQVQLTLVFDL